MMLPDDVSTELLTRLRRIEGQVRGLQQMVETGRECRDIITQVQAVAKAVDRVGFRLLLCGLEQCIESPDEAAAQGFDRGEIEAMFLKLA